MESFDYVPRCNFCSRDISQVSRMVAGEECHVCSDCVDGLHELVHSPQTRIADGPAYSNVASLEFFRPRADRH
jgi:ATP-dependent protease Clp ATPase subunit